MKYDIISKVICALFDERVHSSAELSSLLGSSRSSIASALGLLIKNNIAVKAKGGYALSPKLYISILKLSQRNIEHTVYTPFCDVRQRLIEPIYSFSQYENIEFAARTTVEHMQKYTCKDCDSKAVFCVIYEYSRLPKLLFPSCFAAPENSFSLTASSIGALYPDSSVIYINTDSRAILLCKGGSLWSSNTSSPLSLSSLSSTLDLIHPDMVITEGDADTSDLSKLCASLNIGHIHMPSHPLLLAEKATAVKALCNMLEQQVKT